MFRLTITCLLFTMAILGCDGPKWSFKTMRFHSSSPFPSKLTQGKPVFFPFELSNATGNPFDPEQVRVEFQARCPDGSRIKHPAFFMTDYELRLDHGREVARTTGRGHWEIRWTPVQPGDYQWSIVAASAGKTCEFVGRSHCAASNIPGFIRISTMDPHYFERTDGSFFYPLGHVIRSPGDTRWRDNDPNNTKIYDEYVNAKTYAYEKWFSKMEENHENFCAIWMTPWWLGLEWSPIYPGYDGVGRYNQIHAAQLDRIFQLAERHNITILLFIMNHGQLSSVTDAEWDTNPYRKANGGFVDTVSEYFNNPLCEEKHRQQLRYILARWGYSPALFGMSLSTEVDWLEPYDGRRCDHATEVVNGISKPYVNVRVQPSVVNDWLRRSSEYIRQNDIHSHLVTTQFFKISNGKKKWPSPAFDFALSNCYEFAFPEVWSQVEGGSGIAEALLGWSRLHDLKKPKLLAEWGGTHLDNSHERLAAELKVGSWALAMTDCAGSTGFWWWSEIDHANLNPYYRAIHRFLDGYDRRGKNLKSVQCRVLMDVGSSWLNGVATPPFIQHPTLDAIVTANEVEALGYVYHQISNEGYIAGRGAEDLRFDKPSDIFLAVPGSLRDGAYTVEFWDTLKGVPISKNEVRLERRGPKTRQLKLIPLRGDFAMKLKRTGD